MTVQIIPIIFFSQDSLLLLSIIWRKRKITRQIQQDQILRPILCSANICSINIKRLLNFILMCFLCINHITFASSVADNVCFVFQANELNGTIYYEDGRIST